MLNLSNSQIFQITYCGVLLLINIISSAGFNRFIDLSFLKNKDVTPLVNRIVSSLHAIILFYCSFSYWIFMAGIWQLFEIPREGSVDNWQGMCIDLMIGYIYYDIIIDIIPEILVKGSGEYLMVAHHVIGLISLLLIRSHDFAPGAHYFLIIFLAEASTPALHASWTLEKLKQTKDIAFLAAGYSLIILFFIFRVCLGPYVAIKIWSERQLWSSLPGYVFILLFGVSIFFCLMNWFWFYKLISKAVRMTSSKKRKD